MFWRKGARRAAEAPEPCLTAPQFPAIPGIDRRVDEFLDRYVEWREECASLEAAYRRWGASTRSRRALAFSAYRAALDREEKAALVYGLVARSVGDRASG